MNDKKFIYNIAMIVIITIMAIGILILYVRNGRQIPSGADFDILNNTETIEESNRQPVDKLTSLFNNNDFISANKMVDDKLIYNPLDIDSLIMKARLLAQEGSLTFKEKELGDQAMVFIDKALTIDPNSVDAYVVKGYIYEIQQNYKNAYVHYDKALSLDPTNAGALSQKGHAKQLQGQATEALVLYEEAIKTDPDNVLALMGIARSQVGTGNLETGKKTFERILRLGSNNRQKAESYYSIGLISEAMDPKDVTTIISYANKSITSDPTYPQAYVLLAKAQFYDSFNSKDETEKNKKITDSFANLEKAIKMAPNLSIAHLQVVMQFMATGNTKNAKIVANGLQSIVPKDITLDAEEKVIMNEIVKKLKTDLK